MGRANMKLSLTQGVHEMPRTFFLTALVVPPKCPRAHLGARPSQSHGRAITPNALFLLLAFETRYILYLAEYLALGGRGSRAPRPVHSISRFILLLLLLLLLLLS
jgi:hypothetical protein